MKKIIAIIAALFPSTPATPTVAGALATFSKLLADLKTVKEHHDAEEEKHAQAAVKAHQDCERIIIEANAAAEAAIRASNAASNAAADEARRAATAIAKIEQFVV